GADNATPSPNLSADYGAINTVLTFTGGSPTIRTVQVTTVNDTIVENTEDYRVTISGPSVGSTVLGQSQVGTNIVDNDATALTWSIAGDKSLSEGNTALYTVSYTGVTLAPGQAATITVTTGDLVGGVNNAT